MDHVMKNEDFSQILPFYHQKKEKKKRKENKKKTEGGQYGYDCLQWSKN